MPHPVIPYSLPVIPFVTIGLPSEIVHFVEVVASGRCHVVVAFVSFPFHFVLSSWSCLLRFDESLVDEQYHFVVSALPILKCVVLLEIVFVVDIAVLLIGVDRRVVAHLWVAVPKCVHYSFPRHEPMIFALDLPFAVVELSLLMLDEAVMLVLHRWFVAEWQFHFVARPKSFHDPCCLPPHQRQHLVGGHFYR